MLPVPACFQVLCQDALMFDRQDPASLRKGSLQKEFEGWPAVLGVQKGITQSFCFDPTQLL